jgi:hypothetical protein
MPTFNWILIVVFAQHITMVTLFPVEREGKPPVFKEEPVTFESRAISLALIGLGEAFLMIVDIISATFCLVPCCLFRLI